MSEAENNDRRKFLTNLVKWATAGAALLVIPAEVTAEEIKKAIQEDDLNMHGPIREAREILALPLSRSAADLFAPYDDGSPFLRRWAVGHVARGPLDQIIVVLVDLDTGGHAELHLYKNHISFLYFG